MENTKKQKKYIVICGSGISGIGKGITVSSIALLLKQAGVRIAVLKIDPYLVNKTDFNRKIPLFVCEYYLLYIEFIFIF